MRRRTLGLMVSVVLAATGVHRAPEHPRPRTPPLRLHRRLRPSRARNAGPGHRLPRRGDGGHPSGSLPRGVGRRVRRSGRRPHDRVAKPRRQRDPGRGHAPRRDDQLRWTRRTHGRMAAGQSGGRAPVPDQALGVPRRSIRDRGPATNEHLVGSKVLSVDGVPIDQVFRRLDPVVPRDNASNLRDARTVFLTSAEVLDGIGIAGDLLTMTLGVESPDGTRRTATIDAVDARRSRTGSAGGSCSYRRTALCSSSVTRPMPFWPRVSVGVPHPLRAVQHRERTQLPGGERDRTGDARTPGRSVGARPPQQRWRRGGRLSRPAPVPRGSRDRPARTALRLDRAADVLRRDEPGGSPRAAGIERRLHRRGLRRRPELLGRSRDGHASQLRAPRVDRQQVLRHRRP